MSCRVSADSVQGWCQDHCSPAPGTKMSLDMIRCNSMGSLSWFQHQCGHNWEQRRGEGGGSIHAVARGWQKHTQGNYNRNLEPLTDSGRSCRCQSRAQGLGCPGLRWQFFKLRLGYPKDENFWTCRSGSVKRQITYRLTYPFQFLQMWNDDSSFYWLDKHIEKCK